MLLTLKTYVYTQKYFLLILKVSTKQMTKFTFMNFRKNVSSKLYHIESSETSRQIVCTASSESMIFAYQGIWVCLHYFSIIFTKGNSFCDFLFASLADIALPNCDLVLKERISLLLEQILSIKSKLLLIREANMYTTELIPLKVYPSTLKLFFILGPVVRN